MNESFHKWIQLVSLKILIQWNDRIKMYEGLESAQLSCSQAGITRKNSSYGQTHVISLLPVPFFSIRHSVSRNPLVTPIVTPSYLRLVFLVTLS